MNKLILILILVINIYAKDKDICVNLLNDKRFFEQKAIDAKRNNDDLYKRWENISIEYNNKYINCKLIMKDSKQSEKIKANTYYKQREF